MYTGSYVQYFRHVQKEYICRVHGEFPDEEVICDQPIEVIK